MFSTTFLDQMGLCRLCLVRERVDVSIFEISDLPSKINVCLPINVDQEDQLPKKICVDCFCKLENFYQFYNVTAQAEQQLLAWLGEEIKFDPSQAVSVSEDVQITESSEPIKLEEDNIDSDEEVIQNPPPAKRKKTISKSTKRKIKGVVFSKKLGPRIFACVACDEKFKSQALVREHYKSNHVVEECYKCDHCDKTFKNLHPFKQHRLEHGAEANAPIFQCDQCNYGTSVKTCLRDHKARMHSDETKYECNYCSKKYKVKADLVVHLGNHEIGGNICEQCGKVYNTQKSLVRHLHKNHLNIYKYQCSVCFCKFASQASLDTHSRENHDPENPLRCEECGQTFKIKLYLSKHRKRVHQKLKKTHLCQICGKSFDAANFFRIHYLTHTDIKPYKCNVCGSSFSQRSALMLHWRKQHPDAMVPPPPIILSSLFETLGLDKGLPAGNE